MSSSLSLSGPYAQDTVTEVARIPPQSKLVKTVQFTPANSPTLFQLAVAAAAVHHDSPRYWLFKRQCYWFADVLLQVLGRTYDTPVSNEGQPDTLVSTV
jgi:hypothetical protein